MQDLLDILNWVTKTVSAQTGAPMEARHWLEFLGKEMGCEWATYWKVNQRTHLLSPAATWHSEMVHPTELKQNTGHSLSMSEGNAGLVWRSQKPIWTTDLIKEMCVPRSLNARAAGLSAGIWFAIKTDQKIFGVIELLSGSFPQKSDELLAAVERLGIQIGKRIAEPHGDRVESRKPD